MVWARLQSGVPSCSSHRGTAFNGIEVHLAIMTLCFGRSLARPLAKLQASKIGWVWGRFRGRLLAHPISRRLRRVLNTRKHSAKESIEYHYEPNSRGKCGRGRLSDRFAAMSGTYPATYTARAARRERVRARRPGVV